MTEQQIEEIRPLLRQLGAAAYTWGAQKHLDLIPPEKLLANVQTAEAAVIEKLRQLSLSA